MALTSSPFMAQLFRAADEAGRAAAARLTPTPMVVTDTLTGQVYQPVAEGVCGFAWVTVRPGNSRFAKYLKDVYGSSKGYQGGVQYWISDYGQSYERKVAYARAFAKVLNDNGVPQAIAEGRLD